ncbi:MAG TPA: GNAT family N-acetyltransferase [Candidatus Dormibacteraeota bacterium]|nr:GNAT family N-acetyltransferase [Candidatus Dormibacteraeota bacterium]
MYRFYLRRAFAGRPPDLLVMREGGRIVSGVGVNYRSVRLAGGGTVAAAILTAGWTAPKARGRGLFSRLIESAIGVVARRGRALALAFVREDNSSGRVLRRLGAHMLPTSYISFEPASSRLPAIGKTPRVRSVPPATIQSAAAREPVENAACFDYPGRLDWRGQFIERPDPVETLAIGDCAAIVERTGDTDRLQLLIGPPAERRAALEALVLRARRADRGFLAFALEETAPERTGPPGMTSKPGHFALLVTGRAKPAAASPGSPWRGVEWRIQPGDRM